MSVAHALVLGILCCIWGGFTVWTMQWITRRVPPENPFLKPGIFGVGLPGWAAAVFVCTRSLSEHRPDKPVLLAAGIFAFAFLPLFLWAGFLWGKGMTAFYPDRRKK